MNRHDFATLAAFVIGLAALAPARAADEKTRTVKAAGVSFEVPATWKAEVLDGAGPRIAQVKVAPAEGDKEAAELLVYSFPGDAGGVEANLKRWQGQFRDKDGKAPAIESARRKGKNVDVTVAEVAGRYVAAVRPGSPETLNKPGFRLLGAIVLAPENAYYFKMIGPDKTIKAAKPGFDALVKSIEAQGR
jgi:hypothetical protein